MTPQLKYQQSVEEELEDVLEGLKGLCDECKHPRCLDRMKAAKKFFLAWRDAYTQRKVLEAKIDELGPLSTHDDDCKATESFQSQSAYHTDGLGKRTYIGTDPLECFDYLCDCGALKVIERLSALKEQLNHLKESK